MLAQLKPPTRSLDKPPSGLPIPTSSNSNGRKGSFLIADILRRPESPERLSSQSEAVASQSYPPGPTRVLPEMNHHHLAHHLPSGRWAGHPHLLAEAASTLVRPTPHYAGFCPPPPQQTFSYGLPVHPDSFRSHHSSCFPTSVGPPGALLHPHHPAGFAFNFHDRLSGAPRPVFLPFLGLGRPLNKRKGGQVRFSADQTTQLEKVFAGKKYLTANERKKMADSLRLSERQVKTWFQNRRAKWRRLRQRDSEGSLEAEPTQESDEADLMSPSDDELSVGGSPSELEDASPLDLHITGEETSLKFG